MKWLCDRWKVLYREEYLERAVKITKNKVHVFDIPQVVNCFKVESDADKDVYKRLKKIKYAYLIPRK